MKKRVSVLLSLCLILLCCLSSLGAAAAQETPYRIQIDWEYTPIFNGPGYEFDHVSDVGKKGVYTITQEVWDIEGYLWGQLKSGAGWVNLSDITDAVKTVPYIQRVPEKDQPIYSGAGYSSRQVGTVEKAANYTIVEERYDTDGNLWGRLKSGKGWIDLTDVLIDPWDFVPYLLHISDPDTPIYAEADYFSDLVGTVGKAGQYTIVAEYWDDVDGALWGKLKSGKGWINLSGEISYSAEPVYFLQYIRRADQPIFSAPSYDSMYAGTVREAGTYTITAQAEDSEGSLWGHLKSDAGWVNLTDIRNDEVNPTPISAGYADEELLSGDYETYAHHDAEFAAPIALRVYEDISSVALTTVNWDEDGAFFEYFLYISDELEKGDVLLASLPFYGDMTAYGIIVTDLDGAEYSYIVSISMRNGMLEFNEFIP